MQSGRAEEENRSHCDTETTWSGMNGCSFAVLAFIGLCLTSLRFQGCRAAKFKLQPQTEECMSATVELEQSQVTVFLHTNA